MNVMLLVICFKGNDNDSTVNIDEQLEFFREYAERMNYTIVGMFFDEAHSFEAINRRAKSREMFREHKKGKFLEAVNCNLHGTSSFMAGLFYSIKEEIKVSRLF